MREAKGNLNYKIYNENLLVYAIYIIVDILSSWGIMSCIQSSLSSFYSSQFTRFSCMSRFWRFSIWTPMSAIKREKQNTEHFVSVSLICIQYIHRATNYTINKENSLNLIKQEIQCYVVKIHNKLLSIFLQNRYVSIFL